MFKIKRNEITKLGIVEPFNEHLIGIIDDKTYYNITDKGVLIETDYNEEKYSLVSENKLIKLSKLGKISKKDLSDLDVIKEALFLKHLERNTQIINGTHTELENILNSESLNLTPYGIRNIKLSNVMTQYFNEAHNAENRKQQFTEYFMTLYKEYPSSFVNSFPENKRKEITDYLLTPIKINIKKEKDKNLTIQKIIIDEDKNYLMGKSSFFKNFSKFLSKKIKEEKIKYTFDYLGSVMPKATRLAMLDIQPHLEESVRQQQESKRIIESKEYHSCF